MGWTGLNAFSRNSGRWNGGTLTIGGTAIQRYTRTLHGQPVKQGVVKFSRNCVGS
jgi:hypothetical protein